MSNRPVIPLEEVYLDRKRMIEMGGFSRTDFLKFCKNHDIYADDNAKYPVFAIMNALNQERKKRQHGNRGEAGMDDLDREKRKEEIMKIRIANQKELGKLIPIEKAMDRTRVAFQTVAAKVRYSIKSASAAISSTIIDNPLLAEEILIKHYNNALDELEREVDNVTWEEEARTTKLSRTELSEDTGEDSGDRSSKDAETPSKD